MCLFKILTGNQIIFQVIKEINMIRKNLVRSLSVIMAAMLAVMAVACGNANGRNATQTGVEIGDESVREGEEKELEESIVGNETISLSESGADKVETVYVSADANGAVNEVVVSEWLKNLNAFSKLSDATELSDIVNIKGKEKFTDNGDGTVTWNAEGSDIYYQGTTDKNLPVDMKITYLLNGKEISPSDLAGKSGKVTIRFEYENKDKQTVEIDGKEIEVFTPFAMVSGIMLDSDKFSNVEITNGKVISDDGSIIVMGVAVPGLKESLNISEDKWDELDDGDELKEKLSNSFEITADVRNFELGTTITMASSDILSDFGMSSLTDSDSLSDMKDDMKKLNDGSDELVDGTRTLKDGTEKFTDGTKKLYDGTLELSDGTKKLYEGTGALSDGTIVLANGVNQLYDGLASYTDGTFQLKDGTLQLADGVAAAKSGSAVLKKGMDDGKIVESAKALAAGSEQVSTGMDKLGSMVSEMSSAMKSLSELETTKQQAKAAYDFLTGSAEWSDNAAAGLKLVSGRDISQSEATALKEAALQTSSGAETVSSGLKTLVDNYSEENITVVVGTLTLGGEETEQSTEQTQDTEEANTLQSQNQTLTQSTEQTQDTEETQNALQSQNQALTQSTEQTQDTEEAQNALQSQNQTLTQSTEQTQDTLQLQSSSDNLLGVSLATTEGSNALAEEVSGMSDNSVTISKEEYEKLTKTAGQYNDLMAKYASLKGGVSSCYEGANKVTGGMTYVQQYNQLCGAAKAVVSTIESIQAQAGKLSMDEQTLGQLNTLIAGAKEVAQGNAKLATGISSLYEGTTKLDEGLLQLQTGADKLADGTQILVSNNGTLMEGAAVLKDGVWQLNSGANELKDGAGKLNDGTRELKDGTKELYDGAKELDDGVKELLDGVVKFDKEGIKKLYETFDGDITDFSDRVKAIQKAGENYKSFGGASDDVDSSVKFVIKTEGIKDLDY